MEPEARDFRQARIDPSDRGHLHPLYSRDSGLKVRYDLSHGRANLVVKDVSKLAHLSKMIGPALADFSQVPEQVFVVFNPHANRDQRRVGLGEATCQRTALCFIKRLAIRKQENSLGHAARKARKLPALRSGAPSPCAFHPSNFEASPRLPEPPASGAAG